MARSISTLTLPLTLLLAVPACGHSLFVDAHDVVGLDATDAARVDGPPAPDAAADAGRDVPPPPPRRFITDSQNRAMTLHGVNVDGSAKNDPLHSPTLTADDVDRLAHVWGMNVARYLVFWDGAEPMPGVLDDAYFDRIQTRLDWFAANHISVFLDMHQDVYAHRFCCDGAPEWAIRDDGLPFALQASWSSNYLEPAVERAFDNFWAYDGPNHDLQDHYGDVWVALARRFHAHPAVLGYDLINEPSPGSRFDVLESALGVGAGPHSMSAQFDQNALGPFHQRLINRIRSVDPDGWIFVEPRFGAAGAGAVQYLPVLTDPRVGENRVVFAPHLYSVAYEGTMHYDPTRDHTVARWEAARIAETRLQNWPIVMGEFGMDYTYPGATEYLDDVLTMADRLMIGWAQWSWAGSWAFWNTTTRTENPNVDQVVRVYAPRIAGTPTGWSWDRNARVFTLTFDTRSDASGPTEIFIPAARFYPAGWSLEVSDPTGTWSQAWDATRQILSVTTDARQPTHRIVVHPS